MAKKFMRFNLFNNTDDEYEEEYETQDYYENEDDDVTPIPKYKSNAGVVNLGQAVNSGQIKVAIFEPVSFDEDAPAIVDALKSKKVCVVNLENMAKTEEARAIFNFLNGAIYSMEGTMKKISKGIFILAPDNADIDGNLKKELESKGLFRW